MRKCVGITRKRVSESKTCIALATLRFLTNLFFMRASWVRKSNYITHTSEDKGSHQRSDQSVRSERCRTSVEKVNPSQVQRKNASSTAELKKVDNFFPLHLNAARWGRRNDAAKTFSIPHPEEEEQHQWHHVTNTWCWLLGRPSAWIWWSPCVRLLV